MALSTDAIAIPLAIVLLAGTIAAVTDVWRFKVYNSLTLPLFLTGVLFHALAPVGHGMFFSLAGAALGFAILIGLYALGGVGAGDVKLLTACGAWLGLWATLYLFIFSGLATGVYAIVLLIRHGGFQRAFISLQIVFSQFFSFFRHLAPEERVEEAARRIDRRRLIPFAAMVAVGMVALLVFERWGMIAK